MANGPNEPPSQTPPTAVWAIGNDSGSWEQFRATQQIAMGWDIPQVDLTGSQTKGQIAARVDNDINPGGGNRYGFLKRFVVDVKPGDIVFCTESDDKVDGIGIIESEYFFEKHTIGGENSQHTRAVDWIIDFHTLDGGQVTLSNAPFRNQSTDVNDYSEDYSEYINKIMEQTNNPQKVEALLTELENRAAEESRGETNNIFIYHAKNLSGNREKTVRQTLNEDQRDAIRETIDDLEDEGLRKALKSLLKYETLTCWGIPQTRKKYQQMRPRDWVVLYANDEEDIDIMRADVVLNSAHSNDRAQLSRAIYDHPRYSCLWFSVTSPRRVDQNWSLFHDQLPGTNEINKLPPTFYSLPADEVKNAGGAATALRKALLEQPLPVDPTSYYPHIQSDDETEAETSHKRKALAHLISGKNVLFYGPPGSGKTRIAKQLTPNLTAEPETETAHAELTQYEVVGGPQLNREGGFGLQWGFLPKAAKKCAESLAKRNKPTWLLIDELNRANLDRAFGAVFTQLDLEYRVEDDPLTIGNSNSEPSTEEQEGDGQAEVTQKEQRLPLAFRLLATMNTSDQAQLFALGYAFRRRFAFVAVPSLLNPDDGSEPQRTPPESVDKAFRPTPESIPPFRDEILPEITNHFGLEPMLENDTPMCFDGLAEQCSSETAASRYLKRTGLLPIDGNKFDALDILSHLAQEANRIDGLELGQGLLIDAAKYVIVHGSIFPGQTDWHVLDEAILAYFLPQFDTVMPDLRKEEVAGTGTQEDGESIESELKDYQDKLAALGLPQSKERLSNAIDEKRVI